MTPLRLEAELVCGRDEARVPDVVPAGFLRRAGDTMSEQQLRVTAVTFVPLLSVLDVLFSPFSAERRLTLAIFIIVLLASVGHASTDRSPKRA